MKTYDERTNDVLNKITAQKKQRRFRAGVAMACLAALLIVLFVPIDFTAMQTWKYRTSPYYDLICRVHDATQAKPQSLWSALDALNRVDANWKSETLDTPLAGVMSPVGSNGTGQENSQYVETTDNQVAGIIEGDLIKRTDRHIFYLGRDQLTVYTIDGVNSKPVGDYKFTFGGKAEVSWYTGETRQMYLSEDCTTVTLVLSGYGNVMQTDKKEAFLCIVSLDVTDPGKITETGRIYLTGSHQTSRLVDGTLMVMSGFAVYKNEIDFDEPETFIPRYGVEGNMQCIPGGKVLIPEELSNVSYTVVTLLDQKTLEMQDTAAFLSYSNALYVSDDTIFATHGYTQDRSTASQIHTVTMTEIGAMSYAGGKLELLGSVHVEGSVKDQYSMDEKAGVLRVATATLERKAQYGDDGRTSQLLPQQRIRNANLYCIDLSDWSVLGKVEAFAPEGETVESVRFHGDNAYVCTAKVVELTDPVYFFDLSDPENITWKDTGTIDGYSSSLVNFENGNLLGIGYGESGGLKIEMYRESDKGVEGFAVYEQPQCMPATAYKSYFIDRERQLIGLPIWRMNEVKYLLLGFDGMQFSELGVFDMDQFYNYNEMRGLVIEDTVYLFDSGFRAIELW